MEKIIIKGITTITVAVKTPYRPLVHGTDVDVTEEA